MPYLKIVTNVSLTPAARENLLKHASKSIAQQLGKPERYVMVEAVGDAALLFGGNDAPAAYVELKSIGLDTSRTKPLSAAVAELLRAELQVTADRIYVEFIDIQGHMWGWNGATF